MLPDADRLMLGGVDAYAHLLSVLNPSHWWKMDEADKGNGQSCLDAVGALNLVYATDATWPTGVSDPGPHSALANGAARLVAAFSGDRTVSGGVPFAGDIEGFTIGYTFKQLLSDTSLRWHFYFPTGTSPSNGNIQVRLATSTGVLSAQIVLSDGASAGATVLFTCDTFVHTYDNLYDVVFAWDGESGDATDAYFVVNGVEYSCTASPSSYTERYLRNSGGIRIARGLGSNDGPKDTVFDDVFWCSHKVAVADAIRYHDLLLKL